MKPVLSILIILTFNVAWAGGISGGGGGTVIQKPIGKSRIENLLTQARLVSYEYFNSSAGTKSLKAISKPTGNDGTASLIKTKIYIERESSCRDRDQVEVDGSVVSPVPDTVCISSKNLGEKLSDDNAFAQTMALVIHEYSHLLGASEEEAVSIQNAALEELNGHDSSKYRGGDAAYRDLHDAIGKLVDRVPRKSLNPDLTLSDKLDYGKLLSFLNIAPMDLDAPWMYDLGLPDNLFLNTKLRAQLYTLLVKWRFIKLGYDVLNFGNAVLSPVDKVNEYKQAFLEKKELNVLDLFKEVDPRSYDNWKLPSSNVTVLKIEDEKDIVESTEALSNELIQVMKDTTVLYFSLIAP